MRGAPSPLALEKKTSRPFMSALPRSAHVLGGVDPQFLRVELDDGLREPVGDPGAVGIAQFAATVSMAVDLNGLRSLRSFINSSAAKIRSIDHVGLRSAGIGLGQHLGGHVARAAAEVLHLDAVLLLEAGVDGIDDLGIKARVEHDLALGLGLLDIDAGGFGWARRPAPRHSGR